MSLYTRARKHIDMNRVKELREENIKRQRIAEVKKQQEEILVELKRIEIKEDLKYSNWRRDLENLNEDMTTASLGMINLEPSPNVLSNETSAFDSEAANVATVVSGGAVKLGVDEGQPFTDLYPGSANTQLRQASFTFDSTRYDTLVVNITNPGGGQGEWCDPNCVFDNIVRYSVYDTDNFNNIISGTLSNGDNTIRLPSNVRVKEMDVYIRQFASNGVYSDGYNPPFTINAISTKRLTPINLFVPLDDPEANSFIRGGLGGDKERREKLKDMLEAGNQWMYIQGLEPSKTSPGDIALDTIPYEPPSPGPGGYKPPGSYDPNKFYDLKTDPSQLPSPNLPSTGPGRSSAPNKDTQVARINDGPMDDPNNIQWPRNNPYKKPKPGPGYRPPVKTA